MHPPPAWGKGTVKISEKNICLGERGGGERSHNFELKIKAAKFQYKDYFWNN